MQGHNVAKKEHPKEYNNVYIICVEYGIERILLPFLTKSFKSKNCVTLEKFSNSHSQGANTPPCPL
jgi:hypothetical protein